MSLAFVIGSQCPSLAYHQSCEAGEHASLSPVMQNANKPPPAPLSLLNGLLFTSVCWRLSRSFEARRRTEALEAPLPLQSEHRLNTPVEKGEIQSSDKGGELDYVNMPYWTEVACGQRVRVCIRVRVFVFVRLLVTVPHTDPLIFTVLKSLHGFVVFYYP